MVTISFLLNLITECIDKPVHIRLYHYFNILMAVMPDHRLPWESHEGHLPRVVVVLPSKLGEVSPSSPHVVQGCLSPDSKPMSALAAIPLQSKDSVMPSISRNVQGCLDTLGFFFLNETEAG